MEKTNVYLYYDPCGRASQTLKKIPKTKEHNVAHFIELFNAMHLNRKY